MGDVCTTRWYAGRNLANAPENAAQKCRQVSPVCSRARAFEHVIVPAIQYPDFIGNTRGVRAKRDVIALRVHDAFFLAFFLFHDVAEDAALFFFIPFARGAQLVEEPSGHGCVCNLLTGRSCLDTLAACLWSGSPSSFTSASINFDGVYSHPQPFQSRLPIWIGGNVQPRSIDRLRESGDGWIPPAGATPELVRSGVRRLSEELGGLDRSFVVQVALGARPGDVGAPSIPGLVEQVPSYADAGATDVSVDLGMVTDGPDDAERTIKEILRRFDDVTE